jgi:hypothetical protein
MTRTKVRPSPLAIGKGLGKSDPAGRGIEVPKRAQAQSEHKIECPRLSNGKFFHDAECWNLDADPLVALSHPIIRRMIGMAERGEKDCALCDVDLRVGHLSAVLISYERDGRVIAQGCCRDCLLTLGFDKASRAMGQTFLDQCCGGGEVLTVHAGTERVQ